MATYKVPQDVEADDKLIGPFSFRQFIYLIIVVLLGALAWGLAQLFIMLALIPAPFILFFAALALPLRKDQPMEIYLAAIISFYLKPRQRIWDPEGIETFISISAPKEINEVRTKNLSENETEKRLDYLANIVDSGGWAIRGSSVQPSSAMISDVFYDAQNTHDILDTNTSVSQSFDHLIGQSTEKNKEQAREMMRTLAQAPPQTQAPTAPVTPPITPANTYPIPTPIPAPMPYTPAPPQPQVPQNIYQPPQQPASQPTQPQQSTSDIPVSADIINLATNSDVSVETLSKEANRLKQKKEASDGELFISLR